MKLVVSFALCFLAVAFASSLFSEQEYSMMFKDWMMKYKMNFHQDEMYSRLQIFKANVDLITRHNQKGASFTMALNEFGAMTDKEFKAMRLGYTHRIHNYIDSLNSLKFMNISVAESVDWRKKGAVNPVKNQANCGSCWAFSTTGAVEGACFLKTGKLLSLSEQELVDCAADYGNEGCNGGLMDNGFEYVHAKGGLATEKDYPYKALDGQCKDVKTRNCAIAGFKDVEKSNEQALKEAVAITPVAIAVNAEDWSQFYQGGIYDRECGPQLDHGVLLVGYGEENGKKYWTIKNSWGAGWGEEGYIRISRADSGAGVVGQCGITEGASFPIF